MYDPSALYKPSALPELAEVDVFSLINETKEIYTLDILSFVTMMDDNFLSMLKPPPPGVYFRNTPIPVIRFDQQACFTKEYWLAGHRIPNIQSFEDFMASDGSVYDHVGRLILQRTRHLETYQKTPNYSWGGYHAVISAVYQFFTALCQIREPYIDVPRDWLSHEYFVKPEYLTSGMLVHPTAMGPCIEAVPAAFSEYSCQAIELLLDHIYAFVSSDKHAIYKIRVSGCSIYIEKGIDARVVEYHQYIRSHMESINHGFAIKTARNY
jgi:hypothetical protein